MKPSLFKKIADHIMDMHMQAMRPCSPREFVAYDALLESREYLRRTTAVEQLRDMERAKNVVAAALRQMVYSK